MKTARESRDEAKEALRANTESYLLHISNEIEAAVAEGKLWVDIYVRGDYIPDVRIQSEMKTELESKGYSWSEHSSNDMREHTPLRIRIDWSGE